MKISAEKFCNIFWERWKRDKIQEKLFFWEGVEKELKKIPKAKIKIIMAKIKKLLKEV